MPIITVTQLNTYVASRLREDGQLRRILLRGEIADFTRNFRSGHCYFTLRDEGASVRAVMFRSHAERLPFAPENGMSVLVQGGVNLYEPSGTYQVNVTDMQPDGIGAQMLALQQRRERLARLGYFDPAHKRKLPVLPQKIGIVTSRSGAAMHDMIQVLERRYPLCTVCVYPALVQGTQAPQSIAEAINAAGRDGCDVILMGRGGGSDGELSAFQAEEVAHAVYHAPVPVVSAVGHEIDHCIADEVADLRASTPTAAAELAVPDIAQLKAAVSTMQQRLTHAFSAVCEEKARAYQAFVHRLERQSPQQRILLQTEQLSALTAKLGHAAEAVFQQCERQWLLTVNRLEAVSPIAILQRGYALVYQEDTLVRQAESLQIGDTLSLRLASGTVTAEVTGICAEGTGEAT